MHSVTLTQPHATLLLADSRRPQRDALSANFQADGYAVLTAPSANAAMALLTSERIALTIVDDSLVGGADQSLLFRVRAGGSIGAPVDPDLPLIVTAGQRNDLACIRALDAGADDYLCAPFSYMELRARVGALLRRQTRASRGARLRVGPLEIDAVSRQAWVNGEPLRLAGKEFALLRLLATEPTRLFTREELLRTVWGWETGAMATSTTRTLDSHACRLRGKLRAAGPEYIINVWGAGYRLCDPVSVESSLGGSEAQVIRIHSRAA